MQMAAIPTDQIAGDLSGTSVSLNAIGDVLAIGAPGNSSSRGRTQIYRFDGVAWNAMGNAIPGQTTNDLSGTSVSLNAAGDRVAIGAPGNDTAGSNSGHVRVYSWNGTQWDKMGLDILGDAANDLSGTSVSLNAAGDRVAIGAPGNSTNSGRTKIYRWNGTVWRQIARDINGLSASRAGTCVSLSQDGTRVGVFSATASTSPAVPHTTLYNITTNKTSDTLKTLTKVYDVSSSLNTLNYPNNY